MTSSDLNLSSHATSALFSPPRTCWCRPQHPGTELTTLDLIAMAPLPQPRSHHPGCVGDVPATLALFAQPWTCWQQDGFFKFLHPRFLTIICAQSVSSVSAALSKVKVLHVTDECLQFHPQLRRTRRTRPLRRQRSH